MKYLVEKFNAEKRERTFGVYNQNAMDKYDDNVRFVTDKVTAFAQDCASGVYRAALNI